MANTMVTADTMAVRIARTSSSDVMPSPPSTSSTMPPMKVTYPLTPMRVEIPGIDAVDRHVERRDTVDGPVTCTQEPTDPNMSAIPQAMMTGSRCSRGRARTSASRGAGGTSRGWRTAAAQIRGARRPDGSPTSTHPLTLQCRRASSAARPSRPARWDSSRRVPPRAFGTAPTGCHPRSGASRRVASFRFFVDHQATSPGPIVPLQEDKVAPSGVGVVDRGLSTGR